MQINKNKDTDTQKVLDDTNNFNSELYSTLKSCKDSDYEKFLNEKQADLSKYINKCIYESKKNELKIDQENIDAKLSTYSKNINERTNNLVDLYNEFSDNVSIKYCYKQHQKLLFDIMILKFQQKNLTIIFQYPKLQAATELNDIREISERKCEKVVEESKRLVEEEYQDTMKCLSNNNKKVTEKRLEIKKQIDNILQKLSTKRNNILDCIEKPQNTRKNQLSCFKNVSN